MKLGKTSNQLIETLKSNETNFITLNQYNKIKCNLENEIKNLSEEKEKLLKNQKIDVHTRIEKLKQKDQEINILESELRQLKSKEVRVFIY